MFLSHHNAMDFGARFPALKIKSARRIDLSDCVHTYEGGFFFVNVD